MTTKTDIAELTSEKLEEIRQRYRQTEVPKCHICGAEMTIQRMSASRITYGCAGAIYDETGCHYDEGRSLADDHYAESRITVVDVSDPDVLALVEALEKAQAQSSKWLEAYHKAVSIGARYEERIAELEEAEQKLCAANVTLDARAELAERRLAEMESRTVTIEPFRSFVTDADLAALHRFAECCDDPESGGHDLEQEQVRRLEAIGALQRSGRISYITGFGDVLISITAGIKWEAE